MTSPYDALEPGYYDKVFHRRAGIQSKWQHLKFARVRSELGSYRRHLDVACGPGTFVGGLPELGTSVGVDIAAPQIAYAVRHYGSETHRFLTIHPGRLPYEDGTFDVVTIIELIEHLSDAEALELLQEASRVTAPGGRLILTTPNYASVWPLMERLVDRLGDVSYAEQHVTHFNRARLRRLLRRAGLQRISVEAFQGLAAFFAPLGWRVADIVEALEPELFKRAYGLLLLAKAEVPQ